MQREPASGGPEGLAPPTVSRHADELIAHACALVGDRFGEARVDTDRGLRVTVIDLDDHDIAEITRAAERLGIAEWVRLERADPVALSMWERLRHDLLRLQEAEPGLLRSYPTPDPGYRRPPITIDLAADAEATAADLQARYGDFVSLQVGAFPYPLSEQPRSDRSWAARIADRASVDPAEMRIELDGPLRLRSGQTTTHGLLLTNLTGDEIAVRTNGQLTAVAVDRTGQAVGGFVGAQHLPQVTFTAKPTATVRLPLLVGTASFIPAQGYTVPPGIWHLLVPLDLGDGRRLLSPALEFTITD